MPKTPQNIQNLPPRHKACIELLCELIKRQSVTPQECGIYEIIKSNLNQTEDFQFLHFDKGGVKNLFAYKILPHATQNKKAPQDNQAQNTMKHFCFMGHIDVVPAGEHWSENPFGGAIKRGKIYGRGAQDMKAGVACFVRAIVDFANQKQNLNQNQNKQAQITSSAKSSQNPKHCPQDDCFIISILLTSDEEGDGIYGTRYVLEKLKKLDLLPTHAIVAEPTCEYKFGDIIKIGRRGSINGSLRVIGKQGHAAYPQKCLNPIEALAVALPLIAGQKLDNGNKHFSPSMLVATDIRGGLEVCNVTPSEVVLRFNLRNSTLTNLSDLEAHLQKAIAMIESKVKGVKCDLTLNQSSKPFLSNADSSLVQNLAKSVEKITHITPELSTGGGTSDARFASAFGIEVAEFGVRNDKIHSIDECVEIAEVLGLYEVFLDFLDNITRQTHTKGFTNENV